MDGGVVDRDDEIASGDQCGKTIEVVEDVDRVGALDLQRMRSVVRVDLGIDIAVLKVDQRDVDAFEGGDERTQFEAALGAGFYAAAAPGDAAQGFAPFTQLCAQFSTASGVGAQVGVGRARKVGA